VTRERLVALLYLVLALFLLLGSTKTRIEKAQWLSNYVFPPFVKSINNIQDAKRLNSENLKLSEQIAKQTLYILNLENRLHTIQNSSDVPPFLSGESFVVAEVINYSGNKWERNLIINKGLRDNIKQNDPVISAEGVVGKIITVSQNYALVLPLSHNLFKLAVMDKNSNVQGVLETDYTGKVYMGMIKLGSQINIGDTLTTSNMSKIFPKGYPIGKIIKLKESQDNLFLKAEIQPFALIENAETVFVLNGNREKNYEKELPTDN
jgi:rod shape-determining protein MreC